MALPINLGGFGHCEWPSVPVRERREEAKGRARRHRDIAFAHRARNDPCDQCGQGGLVFLALAGPAVRQLGDSAPRWPAGSPAQWQRPRTWPRMWICVGPRDPATKPSRGAPSCSWVKHDSAASYIKSSRGGGAVAKKTFHVAGCIWLLLSFWWFSGRWRALSKGTYPPPRAP